MEGIRIRRRPLKNFPVIESGLSATSAAVPWATILPPCTPAPGPRSDRMTHGGNPDPAPSAQEFSRDRVGALGDLRRGPLGDDPPAMHAGTGTEVRSDDAWRESGSGAVRSRIFP